MRSAIHWAWVLVLALGCDPTAKASGEEISRGEPSKEYETCGATSECEPGLRCVDRVCRSTTAAIVGDYYAAVGELALSSGEIVDAVNAYDKAVNQYKVAKKEAPLALHCRHGAVLTAGRSEKDAAERAARALHMCARLAPVGSAMRRRALDNLAVLGGSGLDPDLLAADDAAKYLTKAPQGPDSDKIKLTLGGNVRTKAASYGQFQTAFGSAIMRGKLLPCWEQYSKASGKSALAATFRFKYRFQQGQFEHQDGFKLSFHDGPAPGDPAAASAVACMKPIVVAEVATFKAGSGRWDGDVTFSLAP